MARMLITVKNNKNARLLPDIFFALKALVDLLGVFYVDLRDGVIAIACTLIAFGE